MALSSCRKRRVGSGSCVSLRMRGKQDCSKQRMLMWCRLYFLIMFNVSVCVWNEFMRIRGTSAPYRVFKYCLSPACHAVVTCAAPSCARTHLDLLHRQV